MALHSTLYPCSLPSGVAYNVTTQGLNEYNERARQDGIIKQVLPQDGATIKPYLQIWSPGGEC